MTNKSFVSMEQRLCLVCAKKFHTEALLIDERGRPRFEKDTVTGWSLCPEHRALYDKGYIAMVAVDESKSEKNANGEISASGAWRTGTVAHVRISLWTKLFDTPVPTNAEGKPLPIVFCDPEIAAQLKEAYDRSMN